MKYEKTRDRLPRQRPASIPAERYQDLATEAEMQAAIEDLVAIRGGRLFHLRRGDHAPELADLPDWLILLPPNVYLIEAKSRKRALTVGQAEVFALLAGCSGLEFGVVRCGRPKDGEIGFDAFVSRLAGDA